VPIGVNYVILCVGTEAEMSGILNKFRVEHGIYGVRVLARSHQLTSGCNSDGEIDNVIEMLKDDLDGCAREMKRLVRLNRSGSLFEGWPSAQDEVVKG
jgi:hypothetical protein